MKLINMLEKLSTSQADPDLAAKAKLCLDKIATIEFDKETEKCEYKTMVFYYVRTTMPDFFKSFKMAKKICRKHKKMKFYKTALTSILEILDKKECGCGCGCDESK